MCHNKSGKAIFVQPVHYEVLEKLLFGVGSPSRSDRKSMIGL
jgi:hypothetical protein